ncbi:hypothetical protein ScPMuIL_014319 [Solemya velum]
MAIDESENDPVFTAFVWQKNLTSVDVQKQLQDTNSTGKNTTSSQYNTTHSRKANNNQRQNVVNIDSSSPFSSSIVHGNDNILSTENANREGKTKNRTWKGQRTRTGTKCKECYKNRNSRKRDKVNRGKKPSVMERDQIRKIMEKVAEEILAGNSHSSDDFHGERTSIISVSYNSKDDKNRKEEDKSKTGESSKKTSPEKTENDWSTDENSNRYEDETWDWSPWGDCTVTCGVGQQERRRRCGPACREMESMVCIKPTCPGDTENNFPSEFYFWEGEDYVPKLPSEQDYIDPEVDACGVWMKCNGPSAQEYIAKSELPACPCFYPLYLGTDDQIWDRHKRKFFSWIDASGADDSINVFKPDAWKCIRSKLVPGITTLAAQHCCFDKHMHLITRGRAAGTPNLVSPQISAELHRKVDIGPWVICKGDWTRYNQVLHPNNMMECKENPDEDEVLRQIEETKHY